MAQKNIIKRIISSPLVQTFLIYVSGGWITLEMTDYIINKYGLNERISDVLPIILLIGLPVAIFLAWYLSREKEEGTVKEVVPSTEKKSHGFLKVLRKKPWFSIPVAVVILLLLFSAIRFIHRQVKTKWAIEHALSDMKYYMQELDIVNAFEISQQARKYISDDPQFIGLDSVITTHLTILTDPLGAEVYYKPYSALEQEWVLLGNTPLVDVKMPNWTLLRWKLVKSGYEDVYASAITLIDTLFRTLHRTGTIPDNMVYVEGIFDETTGNFLSREKQGFFIDKYEITNNEFKEFIDQGGYQNSEYWQNEFVKQDDTLTIEEAMEFFTDVTGQHGPADWVVGDYPDGQDDYPVGGISWYEACAYAFFVGKDLPSLWHWRSAAGHQVSDFINWASSKVIPLSNMKGKSPEPVGKNQGIGPFGTYDMAGNVREWCWNKSPVERAISGGAWNDVSYMWVSRSQLPAFDRSSKNGFRCVIYTSKDSLWETILKPIPPWGVQRNYRSEEPVSEMEYNIYKKQFLYDNLALNSIIEERDESPEDWIIEKISFDAAYENERMIAYLFLPKIATPPFQTIIYFPGIGALNKTSVLKDRGTYWFIDYLLKNGRAVILPVYKGTYDRRDGSCNYKTMPDESHKYTECLIKYIKDFKRTVDYLETREDIDTAKLCFLGFSWGGFMGAIIPAVEPRLKLSILLLGGLKGWNQFPEADEFNYVSHVQVPVLMLNGKYDTRFPFESTVAPMYDLLGTPEEHKKLVLYETGHFVPKTEMIKETLNWLDKYFGPVNR